MWSSVVSFSCLDCVINTGTPWPSATLHFPWTRGTFTATCTSTASCRRWWRSQPTLCHGFCFAGAPDDWVSRPPSSWEDSSYSSHSSYQQVRHLSGSVYSWTHTFLCQLCVSCHLNFYSSRPDLFCHHTRDDREVCRDDNIHRRVRLHSRAVPDRAEEHGSGRLLHGLQDWQHHRSVLHLLK